MISTEGNLRIFFLFVQSAIWSLSTCTPVQAPVKTVQLSPWDDDDWDWFRRRTTRRPFIWERYTSRPDDYNYNHDSTSSSNLFLIIILPTAVFCLLLFLCKYFICRENGDTYESTATLHPPPSRTIPPPETRTEQPPQSRRTFTGPQSLWNANRTPGGTSYGSSTRDGTGASSRSNPSDKPPGYSEVIISDLGGQEMKFPEVSPRPHDSPPPKYDEGNFARY